MGACAFSCKNMKIQRGGDKHAGKTWLPYFQNELESLTDDCRVSIAHKVNIFYTGSTNLNVLPYTSSIFMRCIN